MRPKGSAELLEARRRVAIARLLEGDDVSEVADFLGVLPWSVQRWWTRYREAGDAGLAAVPALGRPPRLTAAQEATVLGWLRTEASPFGFASPHWTAPRLAQVIQQQLGVRFHPRYLNAWLTARGISPQLPEPVPRERNPALIDEWVATVWPAIKRGRSGAAPGSFSPTNRAS